jgi:hypothetical protein
MIGAPKLLFQITPPLALASAIGTFLAVGVLQPSELNNPFFWVSAGLALSTNLVLGVMAKSFPDHAIIMVVSLMLGCANWAALTWNPEPPGRYEDAKLVGCTLQF